MNYAIGILQGLSVLLTGVYAFLTYQILKANKAQITSSVRPYVYFEVLLYAGSVELVLKNSGRTAALDVHVSISPDLQSLVRGKSRPACLTSSTLPMLLPGREIREYAESFEELKKRIKPPLFRGTLQYRDGSGNGYNEPFQCDLEVLEGMAFIGHPVAAEELRRIAERLDEIHKNIERASK